MDETLNPSRILTADGRSIDLMQSLERWVDGVEFPELDHQPHGVPQVASASGEGLSTRHTLRRSQAAAIHRLTRALGGASGLSEVGPIVLSHLVRVVPSRVASLAVPSGENDLLIAASHGYPLALVEHVRIPVGSGIIGAVYEKRKPLCVADVASMPAMQSRARYRTNSFVALPVVAGSEALGVVCLTDRLDCRPFTRGDVTALRRLIAPAALALLLDRARREAESYAYAAVSDPVSGLFNRRYFQMRLEEELQRSERTGASVALLMMDLDDFKLINDRFGHVIGDLVIRVVGDLLRGSVRLFDVCTRFGGEEFAVVMPGSGLDDAVRVAERIRQRVEAFRFDQSDLPDLRLTMSVGASVARGMSARELVERSDSALYVAKRAGKNRVFTGDVHVASAPDSAAPRS